jgi:5-methylcytosine-specific restriction endonuclease McrA
MPNFHATRQWRRLAAACLRQQPVCWTPECGYPLAHVNHIIPRASGGRDTLMNLRGLCDACHYSRSG